MKIRNKMGLRTLHWGKSSLDKERRRKSSGESPMLASRVELALDSIGKQFGEHVGCQTISKARDMPRETAFICLILKASNHCWESKSSTCKLEWPGLNPNWWLEMRHFSIKWMILRQLRWWIPRHCYVWKWASSVWKWRGKTPCPHKLWWMPALKKMF